jgi:hypothetical protein
MADHYHVYEVQRSLVGDRRLMLSYSMLHREPAVTRARAILGKETSVLIEPCQLELPPSKQPHDCPATMADRNF